MRTVAAICLVAIAGSAAAASLTDSNYEFLFSSWREQFARDYPSEDEVNMRFAIFKANLDKITAHNEKGESWTMALNHFGDMTTKEFAMGRIGGFVPRNLRRSAPAGALVVDESADVSNPSSVDWTTKGVVTPVKNQGQCGSCWAFSTTGSIESINAINGNPLTSLSEQQLVDCSGSYGNQGCNGGLMDSAFQYVIHNGGLCTEGAYPYHATDGTCQSSSCKSAVTIASYKDVARDSDTAFENAVAKQPVSIAIEADQSSFQFYSGGVLTANCGTNLDHGVLAVGYGTMSGTQYWKVKNSWGASWGMSGYVLLARGEQYNGGKGQCGIYTTGSTPEQ